MKIKEPFGYDTTNFAMKRQRLEVLLSAWRVPPYWLPNDASDFAPVPPPETELANAEERTAWLAILNCAEPVPPRTHLSGMRTHAKLKGLDLAALVERDVVRIIENRVAIRWLADPLPEGRSWSVYVSPEAAGLDKETCERVLRKRLREVGWHGGTFVATHPWHGFNETALALVSHVLVTLDGSAIERVWQLSQALGVGGPFLALLPRRARRLLSERLFQILGSSSEHLGFATDVQLETFAEGLRDGARTSELPDVASKNSRFTSLVQAERLLEHGHREIGDHYYDDVASALATIADVYRLGEYLNAAPAGRTLFEAFDTVCRLRPELIATYVWHPSFRAEGAFALTQLPRQLQLAPNRTLFLTDEWLEVQELAREQIVFGDRAVDWASAVALGIEDESRAIGHDLNGVLHPLPQHTPYRDRGVWAAAAHEADRSAAIVVVLNEQLLGGHRHSLAALVFTLRFVSALRAAGDLVSARVLAEAFVAAYRMSMTLDASLFSPPEGLSSFPSLLDEVRVALAVPEGSDVWLGWLRPFDLASYIGAAQGEAPLEYDSRRISPYYDVPRALRTHAELLVAQATASPNCDEAIEAALELYATERRLLAGATFGWHALSLTSQWARDGEPLFVQLGRVLRKHQRGLDWINKLLDADSPPHVLAQTLVGLGSETKLRAIVEPRLRERLKQLLAEDGRVALGQALDLAQLLHKAALGRDAERFARRVLQITESMPPSAHATPYADAAYAILAGALAQQRMWEDVVEFDAAVEGAPQRLFIANMRALALMELKRMEEAAMTLSSVLEKEPTNPVALINRTALLVQTSQWDEAIAAAAAARQVLPRDAWVDLACNEAVARDQLGDKAGARAALDRVDGDVEATLVLRMARERLDLKDAAPQLAVREEAPLNLVAETASKAVGNSVATPAPADALIDIAIITALPEEYQAVYERLADPKPAASSGQFRNIFAWVVGAIPRASGNGSFRVVLAMAGRSGNLRTQATTLRTIDRWKPEVVLFSGIAGGLKKDDLKQGDIVLSSTIWYYEYGKVADGKYLPRQRDSFQTHSGLLTTAEAFRGADSGWKACKTTAPKEGHVPKCLSGMIGSGEKVIDDLDPAFVRAVLNARPELQAIEMEAAGAADAIKLIGEEGQAVAFMMVRGISDLPRGKSGKKGKKGASDSVGAGTEQRDGWKLYASAIAAHFISTWVASPWWLFEPRAGSPAAPPT